MKDGYFCDFDRNFAIGARPAAPMPRFGRRPRTQLQRCAPDCALVMCMRCAVMVCKSGAIPSGGRLGHGLGFTLTEWPSFTPLDDTPLRAGMVLTLEPGCVTGAGRIMVHEENIVLREDGAELLSPRAPAVLPEITP